MSSSAGTGARNTSGNDSNPGLPPATQGQAGSGWTPGRVVAVVAGSVLALLSLGLLGGGAALLWGDQAMRHDGYVTTDSATYSTTGRALASERVDLGWDSLVTGFIGEVRIRVSATDPARPVFVAIGAADRVAAYLSGAAYTTVTGTGPGGLVAHPGAVIPAPPRTAGIWTAQAAGTGTVTLRWRAETGNWMVVAMNPDGSPGLAVRADVGAQAPWLFRLAVELIVGGIVAGALSAALVIAPVRLASRVR